MKVIIFEKDGEACIHAPYTDNGITCESQLNSKDFKDSTNNAELYIQDDSEFPSKILFNAWEIKNKKMALNIPKGKEVAHTIRREKRTIALADNIEQIKQDSAGIPIKGNAQTLKNENAAYMSDIDDVSQLAIDAATNEAELLEAFVEL